MCAVPCANLHHDREVSQCFGSRCSIHGDWTLCLQAGNTVFLSCVCRVLLAVGLSLGSLRVEPCSGSPQPRHHPDTAPAAVTLLLGFMV